MARLLEARCWIPREVTIGPLRVDAATVTLTAASKAFGALSVPGADATVALEHADDAAPDEVLFDDVWRIGLTAINRVVTLALHVSGRAAVAPPLAYYETYEPTITETTSGRRAVTIAERPPAPVVIPNAPDMTARLQKLLSPSAHSLDAEALWYDALEAACADRGREAVVTARVAVEVAWTDVANAAVDHYLAAATDPLRVVLREIRHEALKGRVSMEDRLDHFSEAILGKSFKKSWPNDKWAAVRKAFETRHKGAHGAGSVGYAEAFGVVRLMRDVLDAIAAERARFP